MHNAFRCGDVVLERRRRQKCTVMWCEGLEIAFFDGRAASETENCNMIHAATPEQHEKAIENVMRRAARVDVERVYKLYGEPKLTNGEELLFNLLDSEPRLFTYAEICAAAGITDNSLKILLWRLRRKRPGRVIQTIHNRGLRLEPAREIVNA